ncbi:fasciclin-like arabinogalactan protein 12 [Cinnamomum micranthum f. kanehirae]|uniref:Fasciclin-like arabinogalactan protein 12 n=1 Tax=Cinnamomum micranthum f. kanehirae TaxID=337451 RepID=A0A3S3P835_9MAGN|nr:fasciclin-like arabinogalactan protein 12 [Cinnamomum micranthum f. kanehirae]
MFFLALAIRTAVGQSPAPGPAGPPNVTAALEKGGQFTTLIRLMQGSQLTSQIDGQLNDTNNGITIFAPSDSAFSSLPAGTLNSLNQQQKSSLIQFHVIPTYIGRSQFQTISNPLRTQAGDSGPYAYPINITTSGSTVNISTGVDNTTISGTVHDDGQLVVYQIDKVLLPMGLFGPKPPAPAPAPAKSKKKKSSAVTARPPSADTSGDMGLRENVVMALVGAAVGVLWL